MNQYKCPNYILYRKQCFLIYLITVYVYDSILVMSILRTSCKYCIKPRITSKHVPLHTSQTSGRVRVLVGTLTWPKSLTVHQQVTFIHTSINIKAVHRVLLQFPGRLLLSLLKFTIRTSHCQLRVPQRDP